MKGGGKGGRSMEGVERKPYSPLQRSKSLLRQNGGKKEIKFSLMVQSGLISWEQAELKRRARSVLPRRWSRRG